MLSLPSLIVSFAASAASVGAGARVELSAGQSPYQASQGEVGFATELRLAAATRLSSALSRTTFRYSPRLLYSLRSFGVEQRPLFWHLVTAAHTDELTSRLRLDLRADASLGELEQGVLSQEALGDSNTTLDFATISVFSAGGSAGLRYSLSRLASISSALDVGYRTSTDLPVLPGVTTGDDDSRVPESFNLSETLGYQRRLSSRLAAALPLTLGYSWSETRGSIGVFALEPGLRYRMDPMTELAAAGGIAYYYVPSGPRPRFPLLPSAQASVTRTFDRDAARSTNGRLSLSYAGSFDRLSGDYRPRATLQGALVQTWVRWSLFGSAWIGVITSGELSERVSRSVFAAQAGGGYQLTNNIGLAFGVRGSARSDEWPAGPLSPNHVGLLGFVSLQGAISDERDAGWVL